MERKPDQFIPTRESLLSRIKDWDDQESWREFYHLYRGLICHTALKAGLTDQEAEDVVQETIISISKTIKGFDYNPQRCAFKTWLRHLTRKRIADCFRKRSRETCVSRVSQEENASDTPLIERVPDNTITLDEFWEEEWRQRVFDTALGRIKNKTSPKQYQVFDLYVVRKLPVKEVAALLDTSVAQVYLIKHRVSQLLKQEVKQVEAQMS